ncbi:MAG TPA: imidazolonepropionase [Phnomibacter sp.]|nr:imidazolonepropionase [Phnomibacter sp.]
MLFTNIHQLVGTHASNAVLRATQLSHLPIIENAFLLAEDGKIKAFGPMDAIGELATNHSFQQVDCTGKLLLPAWVDSHTHLVFAGSRENEMVDKINGATYAEIAAKGGGILSSASRLQQTSEDDLFAMALARLQSVIKMGTGAIEIKSGYGLTVDAELKMLRVVKRLKQVSPIPVKASFLGAHALPTEYQQSRGAYIQLIIEKMLPAIAAEQLADYIDVFCEQGFFTVDECRAVIEAGKAIGLLPKIHANQLHVSGGVELGVSTNAISVDHLEAMDEAAIHALAGSPTIGTMLPTAAFFLRMQYPPARQMINAGCALSLASDYNPGSSPSGNMNFVVALSCIQMKMTPAEAINAATINAANALQLENEVGSIAVGKKANLLLTQKMNSINYLPYAFGENLIEQVFVNGEAV